MLPAPRCRPDPARDGTRGTRSAASRAPATTAAVSTRRIVRRRAPPFPRGPCRAHARRPAPLRADEHRPAWRATAGPRPARPGRPTAGSSRRSASSRLWLSTTSGRRGPARLHGRLPGDPPQPLRAARAAAWASGRTTVRSATSGMMRSTPSSTAWPPPTRSGRLRPARNRPSISGKRGGLTSSIGPTTIEPGEPTRPSRRARRRPRPLPVPPQAHIRP